MNKRKFYTVYQITNQINGKVYIGKHSTYRQNDYYFGSGKAIRNAIAKHGKSNFIKTILFNGFTEDDAYWFESIVVTPEFIQRQDTYNEIPGGKGSVSGEFNINYGRRLTDEHKRKVSLAQKGVKRGPFSEQVKRNMSLGQTGKKFSQETKDKMSASRRGEKNHMYGQPASLETKAKQSKAKLKYTYEVMTPDGVIVSTDNIEQFCKQHGLNAGNMYGPKKKSKGYSIISRTPITP